MIKLFLSTTLLLSTAFTPPTWLTDLNKAEQIAKTEHKLILLNFSGSDWCIPCMKLRADIFNSDAFTQYANNNLILVNADFPRLKKNQLSKDQQKKNDKLADKYNPQGSFPYTLLLTAEGKVIKAWDGYPNVTAERFTGQIKELLNARN